MYICKCGNAYESYSDWFLECKCEYCKAYNHIRIRLKDNYCILFDFVDNYFYYETFQPNFHNSFSPTHKRVKIDMPKFESLEESVDFLIRYAENVEFI